MSKYVADAIDRNFTSPNVPDSNLECANVVDVIASLAWSAKRIAEAITPNVAAGHDEVGGHVESLTEAAMGITSALCKISYSIDGLAEAVREHDA